jgi:hypothetical protein
MNMPKNLLMLKEDENGGSKLHRFVAVVGVWALTYAFVKESTRNTMEWLDYVGYATGMTIMYAPVLAIKLIRAIKGGAADEAEARVEADRVLASAKVKEDKILADAKVEEEKR